MFSVGQRVWHRDGKRSGKVLECDGGRVYLEQDNGAELEFPETELTAAPPDAGQSSHTRSMDGDSAPKQAGYVMPNRNLALGEGAIVPWQRTTGEGSAWFVALLEAEKANTSGGRWEMNSATGGPPAFSESSR